MANIKRNTYINIKSPYKSNVDYFNLFLKNVNHLLKKNYTYSKSSGRTYIKSPKNTICIVKAKFFFDNIHEHIKYITRDGVGLDGKKPDIIYKNNILFPDGIQYRFIISPSISIDNKDMSLLSEKVISYLSSILDNDKQVYTFFYSIHYNTDHPHIHLVCNIDNKKYRFNKLIINKILRKNIEKHIYTKYSNVFNEELYKVKELKLLDLYKYKYIDNDFIIKDKDILLKHNLIEYINNHYILTDKYYKYYKYFKRFNNYFEKLINYNELYSLNKNESISGTIVEKGNIDELSNNNYIIVFSNNKYYYIPLRNKIIYNINDVVSVINKADNLSLLPISNVKMVKKYDRLRP